MIVPLSVEIARGIYHAAQLAIVIWREARGASVAAKVAVGYSILNRVARPKWWGRTLIQVIWKKWQYSSMTAPGDPQLNLYPEAEDPSFQECLAVARAVLLGTEPNLYPGADSYYDSSMDDHPPKWAAAAKFVGSVPSPHGNTLHFYDTDHDWEAPVTGHV